MYRKISAPVMTSLAIDFSFDVVRSVEQGPAVSRAYPAQLPDLFAGEQLILVGRYDTSGRAKVTLTGKLRGEDQSFDFPAEFVQHSNDSSYAFVEKLWAMRRVGEIIDELDLQGRNEELIRELVMLSTKHGILTPYTSFLADDTGRELAAAERLRQADATVHRLEEAYGRAGFAQRSQKEALRAANRALAPSLSFSDEPGARTAPTADAAARDLETDAPLVVSGIRSVNEQTLYRENNVWVTPETSELDLERDSGKITVVEQFSDAYFELVRENTRAENELLSSQQPGERLLVQFRGRNYLIE
jgi:Ca-activated chloride channel family protein